MKKILLMALAVLLLFSAMPVYAAEAVTPDRQTANYMMSTASDGAPNWFNGTYYSSLYPDLQQAFGTDEAALYRHAMTHGFKEGRTVLPILDVAKYRAFYPDLDAAFGDNWGRYVRHYFEYGILEGRANFTGFDPVAYLNVYPDLRAAFGDDLSRAARHYLEYGMAEGRTASRPAAGASLPDSSGPVSGVSDERDSSGTGPVIMYEGDRAVWYKWYDAGVLMSYEEMDAQERLAKLVIYEDGEVDVTGIYEYSADGLTRTIRYYDASNVYTGKYVEVRDGQGRIQKEYDYVYNAASGADELDWYRIYTYGHPEPYDHMCSENTEYRADGTRIAVHKYNTNGRIISVYYYDETDALSSYDLYEYTFTGDAAGLYSKVSTYRADNTRSQVHYYDETGNFVKYELYDTAGELTGTFDGDGNPI